MTAEPEPNARTAGTARRSGDDNTLKSLRKIVRVLDCFTTTRRSLSVTEICRMTDFPRSTAHRLLASMREVGFLEQERERDEYRLGLRLFELGSVVLANLDLHREGRSVVTALHRLTGRIVHLAVFDGARAVVIDRAEPGADSFVPSTYVENTPAYCTSVGKAVLAFQAAPVVDRVIAAGLDAFTDATITDADALRADLALTRQRGYALDEGEHQPGLRCVGAPIRNQSGTVFGALSVSAPSWQLPAAETAELAKIVTHHADLVSRRLGYGD